MVYRYVALGRTVAMKDPRHSQFSTRQYQSLTRDGQQVTLAHDPDGNQARGPLPMDVPGTTSQMTWDAENRLKTVTTSAGDLITHHYAPGSGRIAREHNGKVSLWLYQGWNPVAEYRGSTAAIATPVHLWTWGQDLSGTRQGAGGVGGLLSETRPAGSSANSGATAISYYPTHDANGNITQYLDATSTPAAHYEYTAFGQAKVATGPQAQTFAHQFSTKQKDSSTGLLYYGYRHYNPSTGRWLSRDPIAEGGGANIFGFNYNSPEGWIDYLGMDPRRSIHLHIRADSSVKRDRMFDLKRDGHLSDLKKSVSDCCEKFKIGCDVDVKASGDAAPGSKPSKTPKPVPSGGYPSDGFADAANAGSVGKDGTIPVTYTQSSNGGGFATGTHLHGAAGAAAKGSGVILDLSGRGVNTLSHELGHVAGKNHHEPANSDPNKAANDIQVMDIKGGKGVSRCFCEGLNTLAK